jgi:hypothetical protein
MNLPTKQQCIEFAIGQCVQYDKPTEFEGEALPGEIILTDEMLARLIEFCQTNQTQGAITQPDSLSCHVSWRYEDMTPIANLNSPT